MTNSGLIPVKHWVCPKGHSRLKQGEHSNSKEIIWALLFKIFRIEIYSGHEMAMFDQNS